MRHLPGAAPPPLLILPSESRHEDQSGHVSHDLQEGESEGKLTGMTRVLKVIPEFLSWAQVPSCNPEMTSIIYPHPATHMLNLFHMVVGEMVFVILQ